MYIIKVKGVAKIPDYVQLRDDKFTLLAYFRVDRPEKSLDKGMATIAANLDRMVAKGTITEEDKFKTINNIITYTDISLFQSRDGGASWLASSAGVPNKWRNTAYWVEFDPDVRGRMWGAFSGTHDLPRPKMWRNRDPEKFLGFVSVCFRQKRKTLRNNLISAYQPAAWEASPHISRRAEQLTIIEFVELYEGIRNARSAAEQLTENGLT